MPTDRPNFPGRRFFLRAAGARLALPLFYSFAASVLGSGLAVSANGIETSPLTRGVWVLENIFGTPPAPPPNESPACMSCHRSITPPGFALENFDPIGRWRANYPGGKPIDASGVLPSGEKFSDIVGLRQALVQRKADFNYACGRKFDAADRPQVEAIAAKVSAQGLGLRDLVETIVQNEAFRKH